jgi:hypothetical protein
MMRSMVVILAMVLMASTATAEDCEEASWSPEVFTFYGDAETIVRHLSDAKMRLPERRLYAVTIEGDGAAEIRLFERQGDGKRFRVSSWKGQALGDLHQQLSSAIRENRGVACIGEQAKGLIRKVGVSTDLGAIPAPVNGRAAFAHSIRGAKGFATVAVYLFC